MAVSTHGEIFWSQIFKKLEFLPSFNSYLRNPGSDPAYNFGNGFTFAEVLAATQDFK
ncbi:hypothetical protein Pfo_016026 [Paulownia fortunei]|nr:hypothetical protein Pfo_016026 [Paulownia fortunei]